MQSERAPILCRLAGSLSIEGRQVVCDSLVKDGKAEWLDKDRTACLVTLHSIQQWAETIHTVVKTRFTSNIMTIDEVYSGEDARGTGVKAML